MTGRLREAGEALEEAVAGLKAAGEDRAAAVAMRTWSVVLLHLDDPRHEEVAAGAVDLLERRAPTPELVTALLGQVGERVMAEDHAGDPRGGRPRHRGGPRARDAGAGGGARVSRRRPLRPGRRGRSGRLPARAGRRRRPGAGDRGRQHQLQPRRVDVRPRRSRGGAGHPSRGDRGGRAAAASASSCAPAGCRSWTTSCGRESGEEALGEAADLARAISRARTTSSTSCSSGRSGCSCRRGGARRPRSAIACRGGRSRTWRRPTSPCSPPTDLLSAAAVRLALGRAREASDLLTACAAVPLVKGCTDYVCRLPEAVRVAVAAGDVALAETLVEGVQPTQPLHEHALASVRARLEEARGRQAEAAEANASAASAWQRLRRTLRRGAGASLAQGRCLDSARTSARGSAASAGGTGDLRPLGRAAGPSRDGRRAGSGCPTSGSVDSAAHPAPQAGAEALGLCRRVAGVALLDGVRLQESSSKTFDSPASASPFSVDAERRGVTPMPTPPVRKASSPTCSDWERCASAFAAAFSSLPISASSRSTC